MLYLFCYPFSLPVWGKFEFLLPPPTHKSLTVPISAQATASIAAKPAYQLIRCRMLHWLTLLAAEVLNICEGLLTRLLCALLLKSLIFSGLMENPLLPMSDACASPYKYLDMLDHIRYPAYKGMLVLNLHGHIPNMETIHIVALLLFPKVRGVPSTAQTQKSITLTALWLSRSPRQARKHIRVGCGTFDSKNSTLSTSKMGWESRKHSSPHKSKTLRVEISSKVPDPQNRSPDWWLLQHLCQDLREAFVVHQALLGGAWRRNDLSSD